MEAVTANPGDTVIWSHEFIPHEQGRMERKIGLPNDLGFPVIRVQVNGRKFDILEPRRNMMAIDLETGDVVYVGGLM